VLPVNFLIFYGQMNLGIYRFQTNKQTTRVASGHQAISIANNCSFYSARANEFWMSSFKGYAFLHDQIQNVWVP
jgi:hypothetical protein